jgi:DNA-binding transcriptional ArsR family regulator
VANVSAILTALHDPTRLRLLELLRDGERSVREITDDADVTQSAVSQHLKVLREARLVAVRPEGTRRLYRVDTTGLAEIRAWVDSFWDEALDAFVRHAESPIQRTTDER